MNPVDFLNVANRFHSSSDEAELRTSIGRSYYATYHVLVQSLSAQGIHFSRKGDDHGRLIHYLAYSGDSRTRRIGGNLRALRSARGRADYNLTRTIDAYQSQLAYQTADRAISLFNSISPGDIQHIAGAISASPPFPSP